MGRKKITQKDRVLQFIRDFGSITSWQAYAELGCTQLATRISELKEIGYEFTKTRISTKNRYGESTHYDEYRLVEREVKA